MAFCNGHLPIGHLRTKAIDGSIQELKFSFADDFIESGLKSLRVLPFGFHVFDAKTQRCRYLGGMLRLKNLACLLYVNP